MIGSEFRSLLGNDGFVQSVCPSFLPVEWAFLGWWTVKPPIIHNPTRKRKILSVALAANPCTPSAPITFGRRQAWRLDAFTRVNCPLRNCIGKLTIRYSLRLRNPTLTIQSPPQLALLATLPQAGGCQKGPACSSYSRPSCTRTGSSRTADLRNPRGGVGFFSRERCGGLTACH